MEKIEFDKIVSDQKKVNNSKLIVDYYKKTIKKCGFLNLSGYDNRECDIKPDIEYGEVRLFEPDDCYSDYIKIKSPIQEGSMRWYGINDNYFIINIGDDCHIVYKMIES
jgi:hypothetical protein